jgi:hypothetical protein
MCCLISILIPSSGPIIRFLQARYNKAWVSGILGSVIASWGLLIAFVAHYPFKSREKRAWNGIAAAVVFWFVVDTTCSLNYGVTVNAVFNLFTLIIFVLPLLFTRKYYVGKGET